PSPDRRAPPPAPSPAHAGTYPSPPPPPATAARPLLAPPHSPPPNQTALPARLSSCPSPLQIQHQTPRVRFIIHNSEFSLSSAALPTPPPRPPLNYDGVPMHPAPTPT